MDRINAALSSLEEAIGATAEPVPSSGWRRLCGPLWPIMGAKQDG